VDRPEPASSRATSVRDKTPVSDSISRRPFAVLRTQTKVVFAWLREQSLVVLTAALVILTAWLILATYRLESVVTSEGVTISREENIINRQALDSPPQVELVARVVPPAYLGSIGAIDFRNQGSSYVSVAYAWCWGDDAPVFDTKRPNTLQLARRFHSITIHGDVSLDFTACSGAIGELATPHEPRFLYSYVVYETPSEICKNREQWFALSRDGRAYDTVTDPGTFPDNLNPVARTAIYRALHAGPSSDRNLGTCLGKGSAL